MRYWYLATAALLGVTVVQALAQVPPVAEFAAGARPGYEADVGDSLPRADLASNIDAGDTRPSIAPTLPTIDLGANAGPTDYLRAARAALLAGQTGQAQQALEMAQTRALDCSGSQDQAAAPSAGLLVAQIRDALSALGGGDRPHAIQLIDLALSG